MEDPMYPRIVASLSALSLVLVLAPDSGAQTTSRTLALVNGVAVTEAEVRKTAATDLEALETKRLQFEATSKSEEHGIVETALDGLIADRVLRAEAEKQGLSVDQLVETEVDAKKVPPTQKEMTDLYNANRSRLAGVSEAAGREQVRSFLEQNSFNAALEAYVEGLRESYGVRSELDPYRVDLDTEGHPSMGLGDAPITIVEFSDFECPFCRHALPALKQIDEAYGDKILLVFRQFPLNNIHPRAQKAAEASLCAHEQGEFWTMHDLLFAEPVELEVASLKAKAAGLGMDTGAFNSCLDSGKNADEVHQDIQAGVVVGVTGTPAIFINGRIVTGAQPFETYAEIIDDELARGNN
jgi:protein-disulfide isomerase